jgi:MFS family permease
VIPRPPTGALRRLLGAWLAIVTGTWALVIALAVHALDAYGAGAVGAVLAARLIPALVAGPVTARLADRGDRARLVAVMAAIEAMAFGGAATAILVGAPLAGLLALVAIGGAAGTAVRPGLEALMPALADTPEELTSATAWWSALDGLGFLLGAGAGGIAVAAIGAGEVILVAAALIALGAGLAIALPRVRAAEADEPADETLIGEVLGGLRALREIPALRTPVLLFACLLLLEGTTDVLIVVLAIRKLDMGNGGPGILYAVWGLGALAASGLLVMLLRRRGYGLALAVGVLAHATGLVLIGLDGVPLAIAAAIPAGIGFALVEFATVALAPRLADDAILGRVYGLLEIIYAGLSGLGALLGPLLVSGVGATGGLAATGGGYAIVGLATWRSLGRLDSGQEDASRVRELLRGVPFLAPLPLPRLERLVRGARSLASRRGETVVARGEVGETFYVIEDGTVEVAEYGRRLGPGASFGEIALLHDVPRTASVRAVSDVRMRVLDRRSFLTAMSSHEGAQSRAHAVATKHLARPEAG